MDKLDLSPAVLPTKPSEADTTLEAITKAKDSLDKVTAEANALYAALTRRGIIPTKAQVSRYKDLLRTETLAQETFNALRKSSDDLLDKSSHRSTASGVGPAVEVPSAIFKGLTTTAGRLQTRRRKSRNGPVALFRHRASRLSRRTRSTRRA